VTYLENAHCLRSIIQINEDNSIDTTRINIDSKNTQTSSPSTFLNYRMAHVRYALLVARRTNNQPTIGRLRVRGLLK